MDTARYNAVDSLSGDTARNTASASGDTVTWVLSLGVFIRLLRYILHFHNAARAVAVSFSTAGVVVLPLVFSRLLMSLPTGTAAIISELHCCRRHRLSIVRSVGAMPCSGAVLPISMRLALTLPSHLCVGCGVV